MSATVTPSSVSTTSTALALPSVGNKIARLTAKAFKDTLPATMKPKEKRAAYEKYAGEFASSGFAALSQEVAAGHLLMKSVRSGKTGNITTVFVPAARKESVSTVKKLRDELATLKAELLALKAPAPAVETPALVTA